MITILYRDNCEGIFFVVAKESTVHALIPPLMQFMLIYTSLYKGTKLVFMLFTHPSDC